ncbi:MAG TPA: PAS domain-containing protein [Rhizomicrobium sp.]
MSQTTVETTAQENPAHFVHPTCVFLRAYWESKRGDRAMPSRADISPSQLKEHLGWVMILEVLPGLRDFRYRLIGTLVTQYFSSDSTGRTVMEAFEPSGEAVAKSVNSVFRKVARDRIVMRTAGDAGWLAEGMEEFEAIYLPLSDDGENVTHILHAFVCDRDRMLLARQIARLNGGKILAPPPPKVA